MRDGRHHIDRTTGSGRRRCEAGSPSSSGSARHLIGLALGCAALLAGGCEEDVAAPPGLEQPFSMYGILSPDQTVQTVLVSPIEPLLYDYPDSIDAVVTSTNLASGETIRWRDSVVVGDRGQVDHVYQAALRPTFGGAYRIEAVRSDGAASAAEVRIPDEIDLRVEDGQGQRLGLHVSGDRARLHHAAVIYHVRWNPFVDRHSPCTYPAGMYTVSDGVDIDETAGGYRIRVDLERDYHRIYGQYTRDLHRETGRNPNRGGLALMDLGIRILIANPEWVPFDDDLDATSLAHPGAMSNVANGFGFIGAGYESTYRIVPDPDALRATSFGDYLIRPPADCSTYCSCR